MNTPLILVMSCFITHQRDRPNRFNRFDVFKYTLQSYSKIQFTHVYLYIKLDEEFKNRADELKTYATTLFANKSIEFNRFENQYELGKFIFNLYSHFGSDQLVWFMQNDDHVFIDTDTRILDEGINLIQNYPAKYKTLSLSHWPETMRVSGSTGAVKRINNYIIYECTAVEPMYIFNMEYLYHIVIETQWPNPYVKRIDGVIPYDFTNYKKQTCFGPLKELCRKFDGYDHVNMDKEACPPLVLPPENNVFPTDPESLRKKMLARHDGLSSNGFVIPEEWIQVHQNTYVI